MLPSLASINHRLESLLKTGAPLTQENKSSERWIYEEIVSNRPESDRSSAGTEAHIPSGSERRKLGNLSNTPCSFSSGDDKCDRAKQLATSPRKRLSPRRATLNVTHAESVERCSQAAYVQPGVSEIMELRAQNKQLRLELDQHAQQPNMNEIMELRAQNKQLRLELDQHAQQLNMNEIMELRAQNKQLRLELDGNRIEGSGGQLVHELNQSMSEELANLTEAIKRLEQARAQDLVALREKDQQIDSLVALVKKYSSQQIDTPNCIQEIDHLKAQLIMSQRQLDVAVQNCQKMALKLREQGIA